MRSLLTLSDVFGTGHHAVGLCGVLAAKRLGAERIIALSRHADRQRRAIKSLVRVGSV